MISLAGKEIKDDENSDGDIEIVFTGERGGEKLFEEDTDWVKSLY